MAKTARVASSRNFREFDRFTHPALAMRPRLQSPSCRRRALRLYASGGFEHYRLHSPEITKGGLRRALVPTVILELIESEFELRYLPIAANDAGIAAAVAAVDAYSNETGAPEVIDAKSSIGRKAAAGAAKATSDETSGAPLIVHLSHKGAGDRFFRDALISLEAETCGSSEDKRPRNATAAIFAAEKAENDEDAGATVGGCVSWCSGSPKDFRQNVHAFSFESPMPRAMRLLGRSYRAVFVVRDPRDLIAEAYLEHLNTTEAWARLPRGDLGGESFQTQLRAMTPSEGIDLEIDRFTASLSLQLGIQRAFGDSRSTGGALDNRVGEFARSLRAFALATDPDVRFVRYEDLLAARAEGFELMGKWFGLSGSALTSFVLACGRAQAAALGLEDELRPVGTATENAGCEGGRCDERWRREQTVLPPGAWREHFTAENEKRFERAHGTMLRSMGYLGGDRVSVSRR